MRFSGWWLYYMIVAFGMVKVVKALIWLICFILFCGNVVYSNDPGYSTKLSLNNGTRLSIFLHLNTRFCFIWLRW